MNFKPKQMKHTRFEPEIQTYKFLFMIPVIDDSNDKTVSYQALPTAGAWSGISLEQASHTLAVLPEQINELFKLPKDLNSPEPAPSSSESPANRMKFCPPNSQHQQSTRDAISMWNRLPMEPWRDLIFAPRNVSIVK